MPDRTSGRNFDNVPTGNTDVTITLTDDNPRPQRSIYNILVIVNPKPDDDPDDPDDPDPDPPEPPGPVNLQPAAEGIVSDLTNTGELAVVLEPDFDLNALVQLFESPARRRLLYDSELEDPFYLDMNSSRKV